MNLDPGAYAFVPDEVLPGIVPITSRIPEDAMTADLLGTERSGHGVIIRDDGLIVTIGYLIAEAESVFIDAGGPGLVPGYVVGYDFDTGFGLVRSTLPLKRPVVKLGHAADIDVGDSVLVAGSKGIESVIEAQLVARQVFAGRWEYLLEDALYTVPAHPEWAGAALLDRDGRLCGIGSLLVKGEASNTDVAANMFVPVDVLVPVIDEICQHGRQLKPSRPWLGLLIHETDDGLLVAGVYRDCPGHEAGLEPGDLIVELDGNPVYSLVDFYRQMWGLGSAGVEVPLGISRDGDVRQVSVRSSDRAGFFRRGPVN